VQESNAVMKNAKKMKRKSDSYESKQFSRSLSWIYVYDWHIIINDVRSDRKEQEINKLRYCLSLHNYVTGETFNIGTINDQQGKKKKNESFHQIN
jgi:hypothetical protein